MAGKDQYEANKAKAEQNKNNSRPMKLWWLRQRDPIARFTLYVALFTLALVGVGVLQSMILVQTDETQRSVQRAFVFVKQGPVEWTIAKTIGDQSVRAIAIELENNGNTQTRFLNVSLYCPRPTAFDKVDPLTAKGEPAFTAPRLLGPKQATLAGTCNYTASELENVRMYSWDLFIAARATYEDIFEKPHITEWCAKVMNLGAGDFAKLGTVPTADLGPCAAQNCADEECKRH
jgi:hypothetical protein